MVDVVIVKGDTMKRESMRLLDKDTRSKCFDEVALGYNEKEAKKEASRCLNCSNPMCMKGCPVGIKIPEFIQAIKNDDVRRAYEIITETSSLPAVCGRVCPQEKQCESKCIKGFKGDAIAIGALERYVADYALENDLVNLSKKEGNCKSVAIIGSGPSGLTCAASLVKEGFKVTIYEALHKAGGVLVYGIPEFRLPKRIVEKEIESLKELGVEIVLNAVIGASISVDELKKEYDAIYIASGAGLPKFMGIPNEDAKGVFSANEILTRINLMGAFKKDSTTPIMRAHKVIVVGGGNVAMDAARSMRRLGSEVHLVYRRSMDELPARHEEVEHAKEEGIIFDILTNPIKIITNSNNFVSGIEVVDMELGEVDDSGRRSVSEKVGSNHIVSADMVIMALGTSPNPLVTANLNIKMNKGLIVVDGTKTSISKVFAGGDVVTGAATVILAMEAGKKAAQEIMEMCDVL